MKNGPIYPLRAVVTDDGKGVATLVCGHSTAYAPCKSKPRAAKRRCYKCEPSLEGGLSLENQRRLERQQDARRRERRAGGES